jgi:hypothetical protein
MVSKQHWDRLRIYIKVIESNLFQGYTVIEIRSFDPYLKPSQAAGATA